MMKTMFGALVTASTLGFAATAFAGQPLQLSDHQMDNVTAGAASGVSVNLNALALGSLQAATETFGQASITQTPVVVFTPFGNITLLNGTVRAMGGSISTN